MHLEEFSASSKCLPACLHDPVPNSKLLFLQLGRVMFFRLWWVSTWTDPSKAGAWLSGILRRLCLLCPLRTPFAGKGVDWSPWHQRGLWNGSSLLEPRHCSRQAPGEKSHHRGRGVNNASSFLHLPLAHLMGGTSRWWGDPSNGKKRCCWLGGWENCPAKQHQLPVPAICLVADGGMQSVEGYWGSPPKPVSSMDASAWDHLPTTTPQGGNIQFIRDLNALFSYPFPQIP